MIALYQLNCASLQAPQVHNHKEEDSGSVFLCGLDLSLLSCLSWWETFLDQRERERGEQSRWERTEWTWSSWGGKGRNIKKKQTPLCDLRNFKETQESILPKHFFPYCECKEDLEFGPNTEANSEFLRNNIKNVHPEFYISFPLRPHLQPNSIQACDAICISRVGVNTLDDLDYLQNGSLGQGRRETGVGHEGGQRGGEATIEGSVSAVEAIRNFDLLEHILSSQDDSQETNFSLNNFKDDEMEDYYENYAL